MHPDAIDRVLRNTQRPLAWIVAFGAFDAYYLYHHCAGKRGLFGGRAACGRAPRAGYDEALRPARVQSGEVGELLCYL